MLWHRPIAAESSYRGRKTSHATSMEFGCRRNSVAFSFGKACSLFENVSFRSFFFFFSFSQELCRLTVCFCEVVAVGAF